MTSVNKLLEIIKKGFLWLVLPITLVLGSIFYLLRRVDTLETEVEQKGAEKELGKVLYDKEKAKQSADELESDFRTALRNYKPDGESK